MSTESLPSSQLRTLLVVEDEPVLRASMIRGLSKLPGLDIAGAGTVREAVELFNALDVSMVVTDLDLPDGSGIELLSAVDRSSRRVPVVVVSAYLRRYGAHLPRRPEVEIFEKPLSLERLREVVRIRIGAAPVEPSPFTVTDFLQLAAMGQRSVTIDVLRQGVKVGAIVIRAGDVWRADDSRGSGVDAFRRLVFASDATVICHATSDDPGERTILGSCESVLLDAARYFDEHGGNVDSAQAEETESLALDEGWSATPASTPASTPTPTPTSRAADFDAVYDEAIEALLSRDFAAAFEAFSRAARLRDDDSRVKANLVRLREMGFGGSA